ncbi:YDG domain-containing protein [Massilia sp. METH4]|uniref:YDG domain-containing protein n=1 Tax=Massilia sp. METH4 TaxID=3123041 RepID=UPI0030CCFF89
MNRIYRVIWNACTGCWQVVSELGSGRVKSSTSRARRRRQATLLALAVATAAAQAAVPLPTGAQVVAGQASVGYSGQTMTVQQSSAKAAIDWSNFSIGQNHTVNFVQPSSSSVALNRVVGTDPSLIQGALNANGHVFLVNPNGVLFSPTAQVNVGGLLASTLNMATDDFMAGNYRLAGASTNAVINQGNIRVAAGGNVALVAAKVSNAGTIDAASGNVLLGAGKDVIVDFGGPVKLRLQEGALDALVENGGAIRADGGTVLMTARSASEITASAINNSGIVQARTLASGAPGQILLLGDMVNGTLYAGGKLDASAPDGGNGGFIETSAAHVQTGPGLSVEAGSARGTGGNWLIDPYDYTINAPAAATLANALNGDTSVTVTTQSSVPGHGGATVTGSGDITVASPITKTGGGNASLTLRADRNIVVNADITSTAGKLDVTLSAANAAGATTGGVTVNGNLKSNGGDILIGGANGSASSGIGYALNSSGSTAAVSVEQAKSILSSGGDITINGRSLVGSNSGSYGGDTAGVYIKSGATILSGTGNLLINGESKGGKNTFGLAFEGNSNTLTTVGSATGGGTTLLNAVNATPGNYSADDLAEGAIGLVSYGNRARIAFQGPSVASWLVYVNGAARLSAYTQSPQLSSCATPYPNCGTMVVPGSNNSYLYATYQAVDMATQPLYVIQSGTGTKVYDGTTAATGVTLNTLSNLSNFSVSSLSPAPAYYTASKNAGFYNKLKASPNNPVNYTTNGMTYAVAYYGTGSYTITPKALTPSAANKVYDGTTAAAVSMSGAIAGDLVTASGTGNFASRNVGTYSVNISNIALSGADAGNYTLAGTSASATASITPRTVTIHGGKTYDGSTSLSNVVIGNLVAGEDLAASGATANSANVASASYIDAITLADGSAGLASNYQLPSLAAASFANGAAITAKALTITGLTAADKVYDGLLGATVTGGTLGGLVGNETLGISAIGGLFADKHVGSGKAVTLSGVTLSDGSGLASNYALAQPAGLTASITPKALSVTGLVASNKTYDGTTGATVSTAGAVFGGLVAGDSVAVTAAGTFADANAGAGKTVTLASTFSGADAANYAIIGQASTVADILRKAVTLTGVGAITRTYDGTATAMLTGALTGMVGTETLGLQGLAGVFADKHAGIGKTVSITGGTLADGTGLAANYSLVLPATTHGTITRKDLAVSGITAADKVYDGGTAAAVDATHAVLAGLVAGDTVAVSSSGSFADKNAGNGKTVALNSTYGGSDAGNYTISGQAATVASIAPKALTVSGITAADKTYDGTTAAGVDASNAVLAGLVGNDTVTVSATGAFADRNAGNGKTVALNSTYGGADAGNYAIAGQAATAASIARKALTVTGLNAVSKTYDGTVAAALTGGTLDGLVAGETVGLAGLAATFADKNAGATKAVTVTGATLTDGTGLASNYTVANPAGLAADITRRALSVTGITAADKVYDGSTAAAVDTSGAALSGLIDGDSVTVSSTGSFADRNAGNGKAVALASTYGGTDVANYAITGQAGTTATITRRALTVSGLAAADKVYDGTTAAALTGGSLVGLVAGESLDLANLAGTFGDKNAGTGKSVTVTALGLLDGTGLASNYTLAQPTGLTASITPKALLVAGLTAADKTYDGTTAATVGTAGATLDGLVAGDAVTLGTSGSFVDRNAGSGKQVDLATTLSGGDSGNYALAGQRTATAAITRRALTLGGITVADKVADGTTTAALTATGVLSGVLANDSVAVNAAGMTAQFAQAAAGSAIPVSIGGQLLSGADAGNYFLAETLAAAGNILAAATPAPVPAPEVVPAPVVAPAPVMVPAPQVVQAPAIAPAPAVSPAPAVPPPPAVIPAAPAPAPINVVATVITPQAAGLVSTLPTPSLGGLAYVAVPEQGTGGVATGAAGQATVDGASSDPSQAVSATERRQTSAQALGAGRDVKYLNVLVVGGGIRTPASVTNGTAADGADQ